MLPLLLAFGTLATAQSSTAVASGSIGKCAVWDYPYTMYNSSPGPARASVQGLR